MKPVVVVVVLCGLSSVCGFVGTTPTFRKPSQVYLEDRIAEMIDQQFYRQTHKQEVEEAWIKRNAEVLEPPLPADYDFDDHMMEDVLSPRELQKDRHLASKDPMAYCADRCLQTGNCDVFEDVFELSPEQVITFCQDCVLSEGEEPCDIPEGFLEDGISKLHP